MYDETLHIACIICPTTANLHITSIPPPTFPNSPISSPHPNPLRLSSVLSFVRYLFNYFLLVFLKLFVLKIIMFLSDISWDRDSFKERPPISDSRLRNNISCPHHKQRKYWGYNIMMDNYFESTKISENLVCFAWFSGLCACGLVYKDLRHFCVYFCVPQCCAFSFTIAYFWYWY